MELNDYISARRLSDESGFCERTIRRWIADGLVPTVHYEHRTLMPRPAALEFAAERKALQSV
jgi:hypothetical protein